MSRGNREIDFEQTDRQGGNARTSSSLHRGGSDANDSGGQRRSSRRTSSGTRGGGAAEDAQLIAQLATMIDSAAVDKPTVSEFISRLEMRGIEVHPSIQTSGRLNGLSYRWKGRTIKGSTIGREYTPAGLQGRKGVRYEPERDDIALRKAAERLRLPEPAERVPVDRDPLERDARRMNRPSGLSRDQEASLMEVGRFRTVAKDDLARYQYGGDVPRMERDIRVLRDRSLVEQRVVSGFRDRRSGAVLVLRSDGALLHRKAANTRFSGDRVRRTTCGHIYVH